MHEFIEQFLRWYFWAFIFITIAQTIFSVRLKAKGMKLKDQGFLELTVATTLFLLSIFY